MLHALNLPPRQALVWFYEISVLLAGATVGMVLYSAWRNRHQPDEPPARDAEPRARQWLLHGLGALWLLDGLLQAQPLMVTRFIGGFLEPLLAGQPAPIVWLLDWGIRVWSINPVLWNVMAEFAQIGIGLGLLLGSPGRGQRVALWASLVWGTIVWVWGEGLGSVFVPGGGWLSGSPGSVLLYMLAALLLLRSPSWWRTHALNWIRWGWVGLWGLSFALQIWPRMGWWTAGGLAGYVQAMAEMPQPTALSRPLYAWAHLLAAHPVWWNALLSAICLGLTLAWIGAPRQRAVGLATLGWVFLTWWFGQDFGVLGGMGTDPNSGVIA